MGCETGYNRRVSFFKVGVANTAPLVSISNVESDLTSVTFTVVPSSAGIVRCAAIDSSNQINLSTVTIDFYKLFDNYLLTGQSQSISVDSLLPSTDYNIYCYSINSLGLELNSIALHDSKQSFKTSCCRKVYVDFSTKSLFVVEGMSDLAVIRVDNSPLSSFVVSIAVLAGDNADTRILYSEDITFSPKEFGPYSVTFPSDLTSNLTVQYISFEVAISSANYTAVFSKAMQQIIPTIKNRSLKEVKGVQIAL